MPSEGIRHVHSKNIVKYEEIIRIVSIAARLGVRKIRLTGGEPLFRRDLHLLIESMNKVPGIEDIGITTNGLLLKTYAPVLAKAGLKRVNVSLDSLQTERYREITRGGDIKRVFEGIHAAEKAGLLPIKINMIPIRGINDDEIEKFAMLTKYSSYHVRFIEFMPIAPRKLWAENKYVPTEEIKERVASIAPIIPVRKRRLGPARYYRYENAPGVLGFISPISHHFCSSCNRLRMTCDGKLRPCLFSETEVDVISAMRSGSTDIEIERILKRSIAIKPKSHSLSSETDFDHLKTMSSIGG
jgi:cyclic pyranopterin phosphate synthase